MPHFINRPSPSTTISHNRNYLAISKHARATIANLNSDLNNKALFTRVILQYSAVYFNRVLSLFITTRALSLRGPNSKCASFISLMRVYRSSLLYRFNFNGMPTSFRLGLITSFGLGLLGLSLVLLKINIKLLRAN